ncbi:MULTISPECIES: alpha/beta hydrolase [Brucella/Ochrobactrum group]|uniref:Alpha/beta hydrolase n=1 Tax=Brucella pseudintermedia TaxID=370111 RepID=A0ABY5UJ62_9HYPH|nr:MULTISPECIES: alpha/beta hydrolase [Brucella/Ochrobactrum group]MCH4543687.1 alpha/beta hydrolase [Ochrobactrum sp. A-1]KAB2681015.1 alpha/beta hydrolase [Brucella pseudintermedia]NKE75275.1 alpha/beta hydrolase [Ochrobactrum sp. MC-1LL]PWU74124.1 esterase [Ochrobactrum sp. POC9]UWL61800.1 alpha/beta hydrolase [Brucella pseudintermedia]
MSSQNTLPENAQAALNGWIEAAGPVVEKIYGTSEASWAQVRTDYMSGLGHLFPAMKDVSYGTATLDSVPTMTAVPEGPEPQRVLLYIHGGGYVHGGVEGYRGLTGRLAKALNAKIYAPDYRQAPEFPFPTPIDDVFAAYRALLSSGVDPKNLVLAGDSAGGAMVVTMMRKARDAGIALPVAGAAFSPWANLTHSGLSATVRDGIDPLCSVEFLNKLARMFLAGELPTHPDASPVFADLHDLAPVLIQIGENEVMLSDAIRLASNLGEARVRVSLEVWPGMFHVWHLLAGVLPEADQAILNAVRFLDDALTSKARTGL